ncbi:DUF2953 domain-containing protein [Methanoplanus sp. FWC-SCC4]|uniref:DUF2953 domain-containing protein n=1 Tax=Methanochimaera problematica TaxID=2609417 RepID=A0AA97FF66_9EURY|nr:DUF2953 domain-containing protein [Methanoplanus sp. FWC-SCC4]WOF16913.1 DUF2953 domain-containing protein [Methanoplanus sp. FWC-SCC4]
MLILAVLILHITVLPVYLRGRIKPGLKNNAYISLAWGILRLRADIKDNETFSVKFMGFSVVEKPVSSLIKKGEEKIKEEKQKPEAPQKSKKTDIKVIFSLKSDVLDILRQISISRLYLRLRFGLDDAAETGMIYGLLMAAKGVLCSEKRVDIDVFPVFDEFAFEPDFEFEITVRRLFRLFLPAFRMYRKISKSSKSSKTSEKNPAELNKSMGAPL